MFRSTIFLDSLKRAVAEEEEFMANRTTIVALLLVSLFSTNKPAQAGNDWEFWSHYEVVSSVNDDLDFRVKPELRYNNDFSDHYYTHVDVGLDWKIKDWFILSPYYRHVEEKKSKDWTVEHRPHLSGTFKWELLGLSFCDRNMLEYRIKEDKESFRYRNKLTLSLPKVTRFGIRPYVTGEPFYDFDVGQFNKNRLYAGLAFKIAKNLKVGVYYILESRKKSSSWTNVNVLGVCLQYRF